MNEIITKQSKVYCLIIIGTFILISCSTPKYSINDFVGQYKRPNYKEKLIFTDSSFVYFREMPEHNAPLWIKNDSLSFGKWGIEKGAQFLYLTSPENYLKSRINLNVKEQTVLNNDTIKFIIHSPVENSFGQHNRQTDVVIYTVFINTENGSLLEEVRRNDKSHSLIEFINPKHYQIKSFSVGAYTGPEFPVRITGTEEVSGYYSPLNTASNRFQIYIPGLTDDFFTIRRLNRDFVKIISKNRLEWDGEIYEKE